MRAASPSNSGDNVNDQVMTYDHESRVTSVTRNGQAVNYVYNRLDTRTSATMGITTNSFLRAGAYVTDPVLADSGAVYTPGISEQRRVGQPADLRWPERALGLSDPFHASVRDDWRCVSGIKCRWCYCCWGRWHDSRFRAGRKPTEAVHPVDQSRCKSCLTDSPHSSVAFSS